MKARCRAAGYTSADLGALEAISKVVAFATVREFSPRTLALVADLHADQQPTAVLVCVHTLMDKLEGVVRALDAGVPLEAALG